MDEKTVTIIIPVYNAEKYLEKCLFSVISQTYQNLQIIIVNDGSTDSSEKIIRQFEKNDKRIISFHTENKGRSAARNLGLENASGEYIVFIDDDDFCRNDMIEKLYARIENDKSDVCICNVLRISGENGEIKKIQCNRKSENFIIKRNIEKENYIIPYLMRPVHAYCLWNKMYKRSIISENNIKFGDDEKMYPEDRLFNLMYFTECSSVSYMEDCLYTHITHPESLSILYRPDAIRRYGGCAFLYKEYLKKNGKWDELKNVYFTVLSWNLLNALICSIRINRESTEEIACELEKICNAEKDLDQIVNLKFFSEDSENVKLCRLLISKDFTGYAERIRFLIQDKNDKFFLMRPAYNANTNIKPE